MSAYPKLTNVERQSQLGLLIIEEAKDDLYLKTHFHGVLAEFLNRDSRQVIFDGDEKEFIDGVAQGDMERVRHVMGTSQCLERLAQHMVLSMAIEQNNLDMLACLCQHPNRNADHIQAALVFHMYHLHVDAAHILINALDVERTACHLLMMASLKEREDLVELLYPFYSAAAVDEMCNHLALVHPNETFYIYDFHAAQQTKHALTEATAGASIQNGPISRM